MFEPRGSGAALASFVLLAAVCGPARADDPPPLVLEGEIPAVAPGVRHVFLDFDVPPGTAEIEIAHDDLAESNILDWGLDGPEGFRGWGGGNTENAVVGELAASRSYLPGPIAPGPWRVVVGLANIEAPPARYRVEITLRGVPALPPEPERAPYAPAAPLAEGPRWFAGDFHVHSRESGDARPTIDALARYAESRGLDFVMLSDHNTTSQLTLYAEAQAAHPHLLLVPGAEVTTYAGHFNAIGATAFVEHRIGLPGTAIADTAAAVRAQGGLVSINHPALALGNACIGCAWEHDLAPDAVDAVEVGTGDVLKPAGAFNDRAVAFFEALWDAGGHPSAVGGSDDHSGGEAMGALDSPIGAPTTLVWAENLSVEALRAGVRAGETVVKLHGPDDPMIEFHPPTPEAPAALSALVTGGAGFSARWVRDGVPGEAVPVDADPFTLTGALDGEAGGSTRVRVEVLQGNRRRTMTGYRVLTVPKAPPPVADAALLPPDAAPPALDAAPPALDAAPPGVDAEAAETDAGDARISLGHDASGGCGIGRPPGSVPGRAGWAWALLVLQALRRGRSRSHRPADRRTRPAPQR